MFDRSISAMYTTVLNTDRKRILSYTLENICMLACASDLRLASTQKSIYAADLQIAPT